MDSQDSEVLSAVRRWADQGHRFALVTVARTWGSAPRPPGAWMALRDDGRVQGSVSGGCIEDDLIARMAAGEFHGTQPFVQRYGVTPDEARRFGLPCGGVVELVIEPAPDAAALGDLARRIAAGQLALRSIDLDSGAATVRDGCRSDQLSWDGRNLTTLHGPAWRLLIIGAGQISRYLASMAQALDYQVLICDPRVEYSAGWDVPGAALLAGMPDNAVVELGLDPRSAVVALTHDPKLDDMALLEALKSPAFYVGALGSRANNARRRERLLQHFDLSEAEIARLHGPVGLPIGSRTPPEIAVSILAEITAIKNGLPPFAATERLPAADRSGCRID
ncbi:MAG: XdhC family protein [Rhizobium sp.]|jgi:xanthine dehydrogenase accessory factor|uniref:XdhC family protein n=1 Tax=Thiobacillus sp. TaxID=924 RepID=UPI0025E54931|nr:XdhC family protein [Thiobacillus sp.]MBW8365381.1 XdhC family protein [Rhizobium sp.]